MLISTHLCLQCECCGSPLVTHESTSNPNFQANPQLICCLKIPTNTPKFISRQLVAHLVDIYAY